MWIILTLVVSAVGAFLGAYLKRKGENLATREDTAAINRAVEAIKSEYAEKLQRLSHQNEQLLQQRSHWHQLRLAALDKRLAVHQEAYTLWRKLFFTLPGPSLRDMVVQCQTWWEQNCLYLTPEAREAFYEAFHRADNHDNLRGDAQAQRENFEQIRATGEIIVVAVQLPSLGEREHNDLRSTSEKDG